uniref:Long form D7 salivary protein D7l2 n=1 Tax=Aedes albopictus TaxID=7160 RepID=Q5MIW6_AEDAL|nr:long form D7 salivary protein D7l2 [Aedes albopictus]
MNILLVLAVVTISSLALVTAKGPFDPEEMHFIFTRCMEDNLKDGPDRVKTLLKWKEWVTEPKDDPATHCFAKCVLEMSGLYDAASGKFDASVIEAQHKAYPNSEDKGKVDAFVKAVQALPPTKNDCTAVFRAFGPVHMAHKATSINLFHDNKALTKGIYEKLGKDIRQRKQSYFEFCENKHYPVGSPKRSDLCKIRQYVVLDDAQFKQHTDCIMKGLRYITKDNILNCDEIKRDFKQVNKDTGALEKVLNTCKAKEPRDVKEKSWHYYKCLVESSVANDFKEAFDYREVRSQNYGYHLMQKQPYNKPAVQAQVSEVDGKQCPS